MPRKPIYQAYTPNTAERHAARRLCADLLPLQYHREGKAMLCEVFDPIEPALLMRLLSDVADGTGHAKSALACVMDHKAYYLRKKHLFWCLKNRMARQLAKKGDVQDG